MVRQKLQTVMPTTILIMVLAQEQNTTCLTMDCSFEASYNWGLANLDKNGDSKNYTK